MARRRGSVRRARSGRGSADSGSRGSSRSTGGRSGRARGGASREPRVGRDGKLEVHCPQCGAQYRMPPDRLDEQFQCRTCARAFYPKTTAGKRPRPQNQAKPFVVGGVLLLGIIVVGWGITAFGGSPSRASRGPAGPVKKQVDLGPGNPRRQAAMAWARSIRDGDDLVFARYSDVAALQQKLGVRPETPWEQTSGETRNELRKAILAGFSEHEEGRYFVHMTPDMATITADAAEADSGEMTLRQSTTDDNPHFRTNSVITLHFRADDGRIRFHDWTVVVPPQRVAPRNTGESYVPHDEIAAPETVEKEFQGETIEVSESPIIALDHLEDTPPELRQRIDRLVDQLVDLETRAIFPIMKELRDIGRPAIPRLLNKIHELHGDLEGNNLQIGRIIRSLRRITGAAFNYQIATHLATDASAARDKRLSSLRQWYAFWYRYHAGEYDELIDKTEGEDLLKKDSDDEKSVDGDKKK